jgi:hypothetical protein
VPAERCGIVRLSFYEHLERRFGCF